MSNGSAVAVDAQARRFPLTAKQLMSLFGLVPLGAYVVCHLWTQMYSVNGPVGAPGHEGYNEALLASHNNPAMLFLEVVGLGIPLLIHALVGLQIIVKMRPNNMRWNTFRNLKYLLQRISAIGVLLFIGAHVLKARLMPAMAGTVENWNGMHEALSEPVTFTVYALGLLGVAYHLANGVWSSSITLGLTTTPRGFRRMEWLSAWVFILLLGMAAVALFGFRPFQTI